MERAGRAGRAICRHAQPESLLGHGRHDRLPVGTDRLAPSLCDRRRQGRRPARSDAGPVRGRFLPALARSPHLDLCRQSGRSRSAPCLAGGVGRRRAEAAFVRRRHRNLSQLRRRYVGRDRHRRHPSRLSGDRRQDAVAAGDAGSGKRLRHARAGAVQGRGRGDGSRPALPAEGGRAASGADLRPWRTAAADAARLPPVGLLFERLRAQPAFRERGLCRALGQLSQRHRLWPRLPRGAGDRARRRQRISRRGRRRALAGGAQ